MALERGEEAKESKLGRLEGEAKHTWRFDSFSFVYLLFINTTEIEELNEIVMEIIEK